MTAKYSPTIRIQTELFSPHLERQPGTRHMPRRSGTLQRAAFAGICSGLLSACIGPAPQLPSPQPIASAPSQTTPAAQHAVSPWWADPWYAGFVKDVRMVRLNDGREISLYCLGSGATTIILEPGPGSGASIWRGIHSKLAEKTRTCAYSRAGIGLSTPGPMPRDATARTEDLEQLLLAADLAPPYLMVAHSAGAYHTRLFAYRNLGKLAGMVLIDPAGDNQLERAAAILPPYADQMRGRIAFNKTCAKPHDTPELLKACETRPDSAMPAAYLPLLRAGEKPTRYATEASEMEAMFMRDDVQLTAQRRHLDALPLIVLTAENATPKGLPETQAKAFSDLWQTMHRELAAESKSGVERTVPGSGHSIHDDRPGAVLAAVDEILAAQREEP